MERVDPFVFINRTLEEAMEIAKDNNYTIEPISNVNGWIPIIKMPKSEYPCIYVALDRESKKIWRIIGKNKKPA